MSLLWSKDSHLGQKIIATLTLYLSISVAVYISAYHDFAPKELIFWPSLIISLSISLILTTLMTKGLTNKKWKPEKEYSTYSPIKKIITHLVLPIFLFFSIWLNFYYLAPRAITTFTGEESFRLDTAIAQKNHGRRKVCEFSIKLHTTKSLLLKVCTNSVFYARSPREEFQVKIHTKESPLGIIITGVDRVQ